MTMYQKNVCVYFFKYMSKRAIFKKKFSYFLFILLIFLFLLIFILNFSKHGCNERKEEETCCVLRIMHVFVYAHEAYCGHLNIDFLRRMTELAILSLIYESMRYRERNIWSQEGMYGFVNCLFLGLQMEKKFKKQTRVKYFTFIFLCKRLGPCLKKDGTCFKVIMLV